MTDFLMGRRTTQCRIVPLVKLNSVQNLLSWEGHVTANN